MTSASELPTRFRLHLESLGIGGPESRLLVGVSGGCDSVALLHLLRFAACVPPSALCVAHLDHAMRPDSHADAEWVAGLCMAWGVSLVRERTDVVLRSEDDARRERYRFLRHAAKGTGAAHILTAHHADDQAETVLFRVLRGTGPEGLGGIASVSPSGVLIRPLLPFWRSEIERYARTAGLRWRTDPTNRSLTPARNRIRHDLLPRIERTVAPAARRNLVRLAELARESEAGWSDMVQSAYSAVVRTDGEVLVLARDALRSYDPALASRVLRRVLRRFDVALPRAGTHAALQFITGTSSGREMLLPGGVRITTEFDTARVERPSRTVPDLPVVIAADQARSGGGEELRLNGQVYRVQWCIGSYQGASGCGLGVWSVALLRETLRFPLLLRGWAPGDRIRLRGGSRRLKKLFGDRRVPKSKRTRIPLLVDAEGAVLWIAGLEQAPATLPKPGTDVLTITITDA